MDSVEKELDSRENDIKNSVEDLFKKHMRITDIDVPEADDQKAATILRAPLKTNIIHRRRK